MQFYRKPASLVIVIISSCFFLTGYMGCSDDDTSHTIEYKYVGLFPTLLKPYYFRNISSIAADKKGNVFVADSNDCNITIITQDGNVADKWRIGNSYYNNLPIAISGDFVFIGGEKYASDGNLLKAISLHESIPFGEENPVLQCLAVSEEGLFFAKYTDENFIRVYSPEGEKLGEWILNNKINTIKIAPDNTVYLGGEGHVEQYSIVGKLLNEYNICEGMVNYAFSPDGVLYALCSNNSIIKCAIDNKTIGCETIIDGDSLLDGAKDLVVSSGEYIFINNGSRILKYDSDGTFIEVWENKNDLLDHPSEIAVSPDGSVYINDAGSHRIQKFTDNGTFILSIKLNDYETQGNDNSGDYVLKSHDIVITKNGDYLYITNTEGHALAKYTKNGLLINSWTPTWNYGYNTLSEISSLTILQDENLLGASGQTIYMLTPDGEFISSWDAESDGIIDIAATFSDQYIFILYDMYALCGDYGCSSGVIGKFDLQGNYITDWDQYEGNSMAISPDNGNIFISSSPDRFNHPSVIMAYDENGEVNTNFKIDLYIEEVSNINVDHMAFSADGQKLFITDSMHKTVFIFKRQ